MKKIKITYSNEIKIENGNSLSFYSYGMLHNKKFKELIRKYIKNNFKIEKTLGFYSTTKIVEKKDTIPLKLTAKTIPREYQKNALWFSKKPIYCGFVESPTGSGKTNMIAYLIAEKNIKTIIIVPKSSLVNQTIKRLKSILDIPAYYIGKLNSKKKDFDFPIMVTTWQALNTLSTRERVLKAGYNMLICDEAHKSTANKLFEFIGEFKSMYKFGFTASPKFSKIKKEEKLYKILGNKLAKIEIELLYKEGFLLRPNVRIVETGVSSSIESGIRYEQEKRVAKNEKFRWVLVNELFSNKNLKHLAPSNRLKKDMVLHPTQDDIVRLAIVAQTINTFLNDLSFEQKIGIAKKGIENNEKRKKIIYTTLSSSYGFQKEGEKAIALFNTVAGAKEFVQVMKKKGYKNVHLVTGKTKNGGEAVDALSRNLKDNYIVASTVQFLGEGTDIPPLLKIALCSPVYPPYADLARLLQILGRVVRPDFENKQKAPLLLLFDDESSGWEFNKKEEAYKYAFDEFKPNFLETLTAELILNSFNDKEKVAKSTNLNKEKVGIKEVDCIEYVEKIFCKVSNKDLFSVDSIVESVTKIGIRSS